VLLSVKPETREYRNLRRDPHVAISVLNPARSDRYAELRLDVIAFELYEDLTFVNRWHGSTPAPISSTATRASAVTR
jgi:hypothetical protein